MQHAFTFDMFVGMLRGGAWLFWGFTGFYVALYVHDSIMGSGGHGKASRPSESYCGTDLSAVADEATVSFALAFILSIAVALCGG